MPARFAGEMMTDLLRKWLAHYDPIHRGWTPNGIANAICTTSGYSFPRIAGGYNLRRACGRPAEASDVMVGAAGGAAAEVLTFPWVRHESGSYEYVLTAISGGGVENWGEATRCAVAFDAAGRWLGPRPNVPRDLRVIPVSGGRFTLRWTYCEAGQAAPPSEFRIYTDRGGPDMDYSRPEARVPYRPGRLHFTFTSAGFAEGMRVRWAVRAVSSAGVEDGNNCTVVGSADSSGPPMTPVLVIESI